MKRQFLTLLIILFPIVSSQSQTVASPSPSTNDQNGMQGRATQSSALREANRLYAESVKLYSQGKYDEAITLAKRILEIREQELGSDHQLVAASLNNLATFYRAKKKFKDASSLHERALAIYEKALGADDLSVARTLDGLALARIGAGKADKAVEALGRALEIREKKLGREHADVVRSLDSLATLYRLIGKYDEAAPLFQRLVEIREKTFGRDNSESQLSLANYTCVLRKLDRQDEAVLLERRFRPEVELKAIDQAPEIGMKGNDAPIPAGTNLTGSGILKGEASSRFTPPYPEAAVAQRVTGRVIVKIIVDENGRVIYACAESGPAVFHLVSEQAAYRWRFTPMQLSGKPIRVSGTISFNFVP
ncbi:MAG: tetratricopeptide repeat protein [Pyrinomonadaceae bacterium]